MTCGVRASGGRTRRCFPDGLAGLLFRVIRRVFFRAGVCVCLLGLLWGCQAQPGEPGVAAKVNDRPISLKLLEFVHAQKISAPSLVPQEALENLKAAYGEALAVLIVEELVAQELAKMGLEVTDAHLRSAENALLSGYQGKAFEETLQEEGISLELWRERLRAKLAMDMFASRELRPRIAITPEEVQQYYKEHAQEFTLPDTVRFIRVESLNEEALRKALGEAVKARNPSDLLTVFTDVTMQNHAYPAAGLPKAWAEALRGLKPGQAGAIVKTGLGYQGFILLERSGARAEGPAQVYPVIEKRLSEQKLALEFSAWLRQALNGCRIEMSPGLVR